MYKHTFEIRRGSLSEIFGLQDGGDFRCSCCIMTNTAVIEIKSPWNRDYFCQLLRMRDIRFRNMSTEAC